MRRRRVAPLRGPFHVRPLVVQVERERSRIAGAFFEHAAPREHEPHSRRALDALARRRDQRVERHGARIDAEGRERAHRVDDETLAMPRDDLGDFRQGVQDAGRSLAMDEADVGDRRIGFQQPLDILRRRRNILGRLERRKAPSHHPGELRKTSSVRAVDQHQHVAVARHERIDRRLHRERPAALHRHANVRIVTVDDVEQLAAHVGRHRIESGVPRAPVAQHCALRRKRSRQRSGCEEDRVAGKESHGRFLEWITGPARFGASVACDA